jgi:hypothetical protein
LVILGNISAMHGPMNVTERKKKERKKKRKLIDVLRIVFEFGISRFDLH